MRIVFNVLNTGLGNNGGSHTIIQSANTLCKLGHEVVIADSSESRYTWDKLKCDHVIVNNINQFPNGDAVIATGLRSLGSTVLCKIPLKFHWIRGHETWVFPEEKIIQMYKETQNVFKLVNGICLKKKLSSFGVESEIVRPGYDVSTLFPASIRSTKPNYPVVLGGLYNSLKGKRQTKRTAWITQTYNFLKDKYNIALYMYGTEETPSDESIYFLKNPSVYEKNKIYNLSDIWLAPTELEGLHIPPAEAMMTECPVIGTDAEMNGMDDYLEHEKTGLISHNKIEDFINMTEMLIKNRDLRLKLGKQAREKVLSLGTREENMKYFVDLISSKII